MQTVFFDLDDTLYDSEQIYADGVKYAWQHYRKSKDTQNLSLKQFRLQYKKARAAVKKILKKSTSARNRLLYFKKLIRNIHGVDRPLLALQLDAAYAQSFKSIDFTSSPQLIRSLSKDCQLGIITNQICHTQFLKIKKLDPQGKYFNNFITSEEVGVEKPNPKIFQYALKLSGCKAKNAIMIGDNWSADIEAALKIGMRAIYISATKHRLEKKYSPKRLLHFKTISELNEKLDGRLSINELFS